MSRFNAVLTEDLRMGSRSNTPDRSTAPRTAAWLTGEREDRQLGEDNTAGINWKVIFEAVFSLHHDRKY